MKNLIELLNATQDREFKITENGKGKNLQQTQRNTYKAELLNAIFQDLSEKWQGVFRSDDGVLIEIPNNAVADSLEPDEYGSGAITVALDLTIKSLNTDANALADSYAQDLAEKQAKKDEQAKAKAKKIAKDKTEREKAKKKTD